MTIERRTALASGCVADPSETNSLSLQARLLLSLIYLQDATRRISYPCKVALATRERSSKLFVPRWLAFLPPPSLRSITLTLPSYDSRFERPIRLWSHAGSRASKAIFSFFFHVRVLVAVNCPHRSCRTGEVESEGICALMRRHQVVSTPVSV